jgi:hypothetical protein
MVDRCGPIAVGVIWFSDQLFLSQAWSAEFESLEL